MDYCYITSVYQATWSNKIAIRYLKQYLVQEGINFCYIDLVVDKVVLGFDASEKKQLEKVFNFDFDTGYIRDISNKYIWEVQRVKQEDVERDYGDDWMVGYNALAEES